MELIEICESQPGDGFFPQREFALVNDDGAKVCRLMAMEIKPKTELDLTVITLPMYQNKGYATEGLKMLINWAAKNGYKKVRLANLFGTETIDKIAKKLYFIKNNKDSEVWNKSITGPLE